jgi:ketosteroid isomerase-like protein
MDLAATLACFTPDARFTIATYNTLYRGRDTEIRAMFERLNVRYAQVWHGDFDHVVQGSNRIASRFRVENITHAGEKLVKHNCNFFRLRGALFEEVFVYMSGDNSLG